MCLPGEKEDIRPGKVGTLNARKKQPAAAGTSNWNPTMLNPTKGNAGSVEDHKGKRTEWDIALHPEGKPGLGKGKVAKPAGTTGFTPTLV